ncbi:AMP-binding protein [Paraglaciecola sp.]|uniref:AMP-binding protein n=1 Tax=Paraglaciecola sp. TaxID=1920173 RepID=UPI0030F48D13
MNSAERLYFYQITQQPAQAIAAIEGDESVTYGALVQRCLAMAEQIQNVSQIKCSLIFLKAHNNVATLVVYLAALQSGQPTMLLDPHISEEKLNALVQTYQPNLLIENQEIRLLHNNQLTLAANLALMLSTSGSTGSAKQVCLSPINLHSNAQSICQYLPIQPSDITITTLPFFYSYGLSVINSHLFAGACIVFNSHSIISREFWQQFKQLQITSFAGVPYSYEMLLRLRFERMDLPSLRYFTQAGGKLAVDKIQQLAAYAKSTNKQFFVMYGQTEATARMAYLNNDLAEQKPHSIGRAIPGGEFALWDDNQQLIEQAEQAGELVYRGPNVMLAYANELAELAKFAPLCELKTGDIAYRDSDGDYVICGRTKRIIKLFGERVNLDEVEALVAQLGYACCCLGEDAKLQVAVLNHPNTNELKMWLSTQLQVNQHAVEVVTVHDLPMTANGKKDYPALKLLLENRFV